MSEFSINNGGIKLGQKDDRCVYTHSGFINIHEKRECISRCRRQSDGRNAMKPQHTPKCLIKKK